MMNNSMLSDIQCMRTAQFSNFERSFSERQRKINYENLAKIENIASGSNDYTFKRKGNEEQFKHSVKVMEKLRAAINSLSTPDPELSSISSDKQSISELVTHRHKLIKLADSSKLGWKVVEQYETHQLADDSDDEKRIHKAEARAEKLDKEDKRKVVSKNRKRWSPLPQTNYSNEEN
ncbi:hypothetical protein FSP39_002370 [Pinctada imbricata]|uniref:Uncharacterized protein n=1 Tax=Pinctada imbricata TaxID=66713 RepID=A0AA89BZQ4_PINIB|nr:hypothetical protein FSP39_002370 [Pinctada imbricata]